MALTLTISSQSATVQSGTKTIAGSIAGTNTIDAITAVTLQAGDNTIAVPANVVGVVIQPPSANSQVLKLKGVGGDTGIQISKINPTVIAFDPAGLPANIIVNAAALTTGLTTFSWF